MIFEPEPCMHGSGMGRAVGTISLLVDVGSAAWRASSYAFRQISRLRTRSTTARPPPSPEATLGEALEDLLRQRDYAPSSARRYRQVVDRFRRQTGWRPGATDGPAHLARFLAMIAADPSVGPMNTVPGRRDPQRLAVRRTTVYAIRAAVDRLHGLQLTTDVSLPPRPPPLPGPSAGVVEALHRAAVDTLGRLLLVLTCELGLRPGQIAALRRGNVRVRRGRVFLSLRRGVLEAALPTACLDILARVARAGAPEEYLFPSPCRGGARPLSVRTLQNMLRRISARAGVGSEATFSCLRKACPSGRVVPVVGLRAAAGLSARRALP